MNPVNATVMAFLVAPVVPAMVFAFMSPDLTNGEPGSTFVFTLVFYWYALMAGVLIGGPLFWVVSRYAVVSWWSAIASGFLGGVFVWLLLGGTQPECSGGLAICSCIGAASALTFWLVWRLGNRVS